MREVGLSGLQTNDLRPQDYVVLLENVQNDQMVEPPGVFGEATACLETEFGSYANGWVSGIVEGRAMSGMLWRRRWT